jgi:uncharacterized membrane protein
MKLRLIAAAVASIFLGFATQSFAQSNDGKAFTHGESKRCEGMSGAAKDQCDKEEATKTQGPAAQDPHQPAATQNERSSTGSSAAGKTFTHGESKRCEGMTGADKDRCDKEEATKSEASK